MCPCEGLPLSYVPVVESYQACQPGGQSADAKLAHGLRKHTYTHTQSFLLLKVALCVMPVPEVVGGHQLTATVIDLSPWVEYEFRVLASNTIGTGEPSKPSKQARTKGTCMYRMSRPLSEMCHVCLFSPSKTNESRHDGAFSRQESHESCYCNYEDTVRR